MKEVDLTRMYEAAEVKLTYVTKTPASERIHIKNAEDAASLFFMTWDIETIEHIEEVKMILLNRSNRVLGVVHLSKGGLSGSIIDTRIVLQYAIKANAHAVILAHNHPSGNLEASDADIKITSRVRDALDLVDIKLLDHIIINKDEDYKPIDDC